MKYLITLVHIICSLTNYITAEDVPNDLRLAKIFTDNMVLQQEKPIIVWGWANPGSSVSVTLTQDANVGEETMKRVKPEPTRSSASEDYAITVQYVERNPPSPTHQTLEAIAGNDGRWSATFEPVKASFQPVWVFAESGDRVAGIQNVLIGKVWICAGQSNMGWSNFNRKDREAASADFPGLRYVAWHDSYGYAIVRDIQRRALKGDPNAGMIATYPTGNSYIHPAEKLPVAEYASLWALAKVYNKPVQHTGNTYRR